ncbi:hypothetical protein CAPTEDRAFT_40254, partial [Capitella teleta]
WIEVDLLTNKFIGGVVTWGHAGGSNYVTTFRIQHRSDGSDTWVDYTDSNGDPRTFVANEDALVATLNQLQEGFVARYVRLYPLTWQGYLFLRWELLSC